MRRLRITSLPCTVYSACFCFWSHCPASAGLFDKPPAPAQLGTPLNNSADFLPVSEAFKLSLIDSSSTSVKLRFVAAKAITCIGTASASAANRLISAWARRFCRQARPKHDEFFGDVEVYYEVLDVEVPVSNPDNRPSTSTSATRAAPTRPVLSAGNQRAGHWRRRNTERGQPRCHNALELDRPGTVFSLAAWR